MKTTTRFYEVTIKTAVADINRYNDYTGMAEGYYEVTAYGDEVKTITKEKNITVAEALYKVMKLTYSKAPERKHLRLEEQNRWMDQSETLWVEWRWTWLAE